MGVRRDHGRPGVRLHEVGTLERGAEAARRSAACAHCGLAVQADLVRGGDARQFCCSGCRQVYTLLHEWGFDQVLPAGRAATGKPGARARHRARVHGLRRRACPGGGDRAARRGTPAHEAVPRRRPLRGLRVAGGEVARRAPGRGRGSPERGQRRRGRSRGGPSTRAFLGSPARSTAWGTRRTSIAPRARRRRAGRKTARAWPGSGSPRRAR